MYEDFVPLRLAKLRLQRGVSARDMSLTLGQASNYINNIENKRMLPSLPAFFAICEYLEITPQEFFDAETKNPTKINELLQAAKGLDDEPLNNIIAIVKGLNK